MNKRARIRVILALSLAAPSFTEARMEGCARGGGSEYGRLEDRILLVQAPGDVFTARPTWAPFGMNTGIPVGPRQKFIVNRDGQTARPYSGGGYGGGGSAADIQALGSMLRSLSSPTRP